MDSNDGSERRDRWARLRFAVVGPLLASPPPAGRLRAELDRLAERDWDHPSGSGPVRFAVSTIERWYYQARAADNDPVGALKRRPRADAGRPRAMSPVLIEALCDQYRAHPSWSAQLHYENLAALVEADPALGPMPSYATLTRAMRARGLVRQRRRKWHESDAKPPVEAREVLSYEVSRSHALWHGDMHRGKRRVLTASGEWKTPILLGFLDDHSRLGCHLQWYLEETAEVFVHGLCQALMKRGLPRSLLTDNGSPMTAGEVEEGLLRLGVVGTTTLAYSPHQNGKIESFWGTVESRLMAMLEGIDALTLKMLNDATVAWLEQEYLRLRMDLGRTGRNPAWPYPCGTRPFECPRPRRAAAPRAISGPTVAGSHRADRGHLSRRPPSSRTRHRENALRKHRRSGRGGSQRHAQDHETRSGPSGSWPISIQQPPAMQRRRRTCSRWRSRIPPQIRRWKEQEKPHRVHALLHLTSDAIVGSLAHGHDSAASDGGGGSEGPERGGGAAHGSTRRRSPDIPSIPRRRNPKSIKQREHRTISYRQRAHRAMHEVRRAGP